MNRHPSEELSTASRDLALGAVHVAVLWSFAFAQPLFDLLGDAPEFFVARGNSAGDILVLAVALVVVPPLCTLAVEALLELISTGLRRAVHLVLIGALAAAFVLQVIQDLPVPAGLTVAMAVLGGALMAVAYSRTRVAPAVLSVLGPTPLVLLLLFLFASPVSRLVLPADRAEAASVGVPGRPPVVMIVFDELAGYVLQGENGRVNAARFPNFARLARNSTWYRNATSVADYTDRAVPALLTGEMPDKGAVPIAADHPESLFTLLGGRYSLDVTEPITDICPPELCPESAARPSIGSRLTQLTDDLSLVSLHLLLPESMAQRLPAVDRSFGNFRAANGAQPAERAPLSAQRVRDALEAAANRVPIFHAFERRLAKMPRRGRLTFFHIELPHSPYEFLPGGQRYRQSGGQELAGIDLADQPSGGAWGDDRAVALHGLQRYMLQVGYADRLLGRALDRLRSRGVYDRALVIVTADHGSAYSPGAPHRAATAENLSEIAGVPLFIKSPDQHSGEIRKSNVKTIDVLPTVADRLGIELPWRVQGQAAERAEHGGRIQLQPHYGDRDLTLGFADFVDERNELIRRMHAGLGETWASLFRADLDLELAGAAIDELAAATLPQANLELDNTGLLSGVDPGGTVVDSLVTGSVTGVPDGARLALVVNGRVVGPAVRFQAGGEERFSAVVPPNSLARGANSVELLAATRTGTLGRVSTVAWRLVRRDGRELIVGGGRSIPIDAAGNGGFLDDITVDGRELRISGWAGDSARKLAAERVMAFDGDHLLGSARPSIERADVAASRGQQLLRSGFTLGPWATRLTPESAPTRVRVFSVYGNRALPVPLAP